MTTPAPVTIIQRRKFIVGKDGFHSAVLDDSGKAQQEWVIQNHIPRKDGRVDWKATAEELGRGWGEAREEIRKLEKDLFELQDDRTEASNDAEWVAANITRPLRTHWSRFLLPHSVRVALGVEL